MKARTLLLAAGVTLFAHGTPVSAQSLFNAAGIGLPVEALDGRARAMGSLGIGLPGESLMPTDPGATARLRFPTGIMAGQPSWVDFSQDGGASGSFRGNRFPLLGIAYPLLSGTMSIQIGAFLDQHFTSEAMDSVDFGGIQVPITDRFIQDGAVSTLSVGYARMVGPNTGVGVTLGRYAGSVVRSLARTYDDETAGVEEYVERGKWSYTGHALTVGASSDLSDQLRVAASVQLPTDLEASASEESRGGDGSFDLPIQYRLGVSSQLAPGIVVAASAALSDWSSTGDDLTETATAGSGHGFGVGIELSRARILGKDAPLRFGFRRSGLPFSFNGDGASERVFSGGIGLALNETNGVLLAGADIALERGRRSGGGVTETFWRMTLSLVLSGS